MLTKVNAFTAYPYSTSTYMFRHYLYKPFFLFNERLPYSYDSSSYYEQNSQTMIARTERPISENPFLYRKINIKKSYSNLTYPKTPRGLQPTIWDQHKFLSRLYRNPYQPTRLIEFKTVERTSSNCKTTIRYEETMNGVGQRQNYLYQEHRISAENNLDVSSTPHMAPMRSDRNTVTNTSLIEYLTKDQTFVRKDPIMVTNSRVFYKPYETKNENMKAEEMKQEDARRQEDKKQQKKRYLPSREPEEEPWEMRQYPEDNLRTPHFEGAVSSEKLYFSLGSKAPVPVNNEELSKTLKVRGRVFELTELC